MENQGLPKFVQGKAKVQGEVGLADTALAAGYGDAQSLVCFGHVSPC